MKLTIRSGLTLAALILSACGPAHDRADDILATAPAGTFGGTSWTMTQATVSKSSDGTTMQVHLFAENAGTCATFPPQSSTTGYVMWNQPAETGRRPLQLSLSDFSSPSNQTVTFVTPPSDNNISIDGIINVTELTATSATIGILAKAGTGYDVNGTFTATLCP